MHEGRTMPIKTMQMNIVVPFLGELFPHVFKGNHMYKYVNKVIYKGFC